MSIELINIWYIVAAALFIFGLKQLGSPATAVRGNLLSSIGMFIRLLPYGDVSGGCSLPFLYTRLALKNKP